MTYTGLRIDDQDIPISREDATILMVAGNMVSQGINTALRVGPKEKGTLVRVRTMEFDTDKGTFSGTFDVVATAKLAQPSTEKDNA